MRLVFACVLGWFVIAAAAAVASRDTGSQKPPPGRHDRSGSLIVTLGVSDSV